MVYGVVGGADYCTVNYFDSGSWLAFASVDANHPCRAGGNSLHGFGESTIYSTAFAADNLPIQWLLVRLYGIWYRRNDVEDGYINSILRASSVVIDFTNTVAHVSTERGFGFAANDKTTGVSLLSIFVSI